MNVLVTAASRHGATAEIAERIAATLRVRGHTVVVRAPEAVTSLDGFDVVILGSAVYTGGWLKAARAFAARFLDDLNRRSVWLFSSGPVGDPLFPQEQPKDVPELLARTGARGHQVFAGRLDPSVLGVVERLAVRAVRVPPGDFRDWTAVGAWAALVADALAAAPGAARPARFGSTP
ncbi:MAG: menaquinone-dependent protoporphyrinogen oxidase [Frankiales bacterium]|jgi:menaquinone-dependent protoporphyrinogen oxidase|nr:menaquinone-dependent protoporphyrinogen oxidase [Frankiales bacterium]